MGTVKIFVALLEEGTNVWRPVMAQQIANNHFLLLGEAPAHESWQFAPGSQVRCKDHIFSDGGHGLVAVEAINV